MAGELGRIFQPLLLSAVAWEAGRMRRSFRRSLERFADVHRRTLLAKVRRNADSEFGRQYGFRSIRSVEDFRRAVPLATYDDYLPWIDRVRRGEVHAMFGRGQRLHMFAMTSGTTDQPKYIPVTGHFLSEYRRGWMTWGIHAFGDHPRAWSGRILKIVSAMDDERSPSGLPCGAMSGLTAHAQRKGTHGLYVLPAAAADIKDTPSKYYVALRASLGLQTLSVLSANPSTLIGLARTLDQRKADLVRDLRDGTLSADIDIAPAIREAVLRRLRPDAAGAARIERLIAGHDPLVPRDVWEIPLLGCWKGGTLGLYLRDVPRYYGDATIRDIGLIASEGRMTIPVSDTGASGPLDVEANFFEFLPSRDGQADADRTVLPHELEPGCEYFLVLTNSAGLYRYNIGDLVRCDGFEAGSPLVTFLSKGANFSNLTGEKLSEHQVAAAVNEALADAGFDLNSYCLAPTWDETAPYYTLLVEQDASRDGAALARFVARLDEVLQRRNMEYDGKRSSGRLGPIRPRIIAAGAWRQYDLRTIAERRRGIEQYKHKFLVGDPKFESQFAAVETAERE